MRVASLTASGAWRAGWLAILIVTAAALLSGCAVRLAPPYDAGIEQETADLHKSVEKFFEQMQSGNAAERSYARNKDFYVETLAALHSLELRARARWTGGSSLLPSFGLGQSADAPKVKSASEEAEMFALLIQVTENVRSAHEGFGMNDTNIPIYREQFRVAFSAILQYESFLKR